MTWTSSFGVGGFYTPPPCTTPTPAARRTGQSVDEYLAAEKRRYRRAVAAGLVDPGPPLEIAITGQITDAKGHWVRRQSARNVLADVSLTINSRGGLALQGIALFRAISCRLGRTTAHVRDGALCGSAALDIFIAADTRTADAGARFLLHRTGLPIDESVVRWTAANLPAVVREMEKLDAWMFRQFVQRCGARLENIISEAARERWMTAISAWQFGIVNRQPVWWS
jgi:ATP-dependent protease ClpP protease subunit